MKQKLEAAARENILFNHRTVDRTLSGKYLAQFGEMNFIQGAEWHAKQSPWISVEDRLPTLGTFDSGVTHWMPIPSFDEILEANRDVLERIKEKGD